MGVRQSMDLVLVKKWEIWGREIMGVLTKYGFGLYREIKEIRQKNDGGLTKYGFGFNKEIKGFWEEKSRGLNTRMRRTFHRLKKILDHNYAHHFILIVLRKWSGMKIKE